MAGTKQNLAHIISDASGVPSTVISGDITFSQLSVAIRMSWAARRQTTRIEDMSYCLLGIFEVNMPLIYGEGTRAFRRLQEEIIRRNNDMTIFGWNLPKHDSSEHGFMGIVANSPAAFMDSSDIVPFADDFANFSITNRGLLLSGGIPLRTANVTMIDGSKERRYLINLGSTWAPYSLLSENPSRHDVGIFLRKIGPDLFYRDGFIPMSGSRRYDEVGQGYHEVDICDVTEIYILLDIEPTAIMSAIFSFREQTLHVPFQHDFHLDSAAPEIWWDHTDRVFLRPKRYRHTSFPALLVMSFITPIAQRDINVIVMCHYGRMSGGVAWLHIFDTEKYQAETAMLLQDKNRQLGISSEDWSAFAPALARRYSTAIDITEGYDLWRISVAIVCGQVPETISTVAGSIEVSWLKLTKQKIERQPENLQY
ncbi:hypothetical protein N0V90_009541 [Kalmusia sp. IMI 367209]|nr:hypothetical protein N0V90_009541 [Kalmusia sp. IMI 367209]